MFMLTTDILIFKVTPCLAHAHIIVYVCMCVFVNLLITNCSTVKYCIQGFTESTSKTYWCFWCIEEICGVSGTFIFMRTRRTAILQPLLPFLNINLQY